MRWVKVAGAVGSLTVVMLNILREHQPQVPLTEDQHTIGEFGSEGAHEPFGEAVLPRAPRRNLDHLDAYLDENSVERGGELAGPVADEKPELGDAITEIHYQVADLLGAVLH